MTLALVAAAFAGSVYINGVRADLLPEMTLEDVTVRIDGAGNLYIDAPGYRARVVSPPAEPTSQTYTPPPRVASAVPPVAAPAPVAATPPSASPASPAAAVGTWWLVTEDNDSAGHQLEVLVNGTLVRRVRSGEPQLILDLSSFLRSGTNTVTITALPSPSLGGGVLNVYVGRGGNAGGTIRIDEPEIRYARRASDPVAGGTRSFSIVLP